MKSHENYKGKARALRNTNNIYSVYIYIYMFIYTAITISNHQTHHIWWRYINDVFTIWTHGKECFNIITEQIKSMHSTIKFTTEWTYTYASLLDVQITMNEKDV